jgi:hypothetical protein
MVKKLLDHDATRQTNALDILAPRIEVTAMRGHVA